MATLEEFRRAYEIIHRGVDPNPPLVVSRSLYDAMNKAGLLDPPLQSPFVSYLSSDWFGALGGIGWIEVRRDEGCSRDCFRVLDSHGQPSAAKFITDRERVMAARTDDLEGAALHRLVADLLSHSDG